MIERTCEICGKTISGEVTDRIEHDLDLISCSDCSEKYLSYPTDKNKRIEDLKTILTDDDSLTPKAKKVLNSQLILYGSKGIVKSKYDKSFYKDQSGLYGNPVVEKVKPNNEKDFNEDQSGLNEKSDIEVLKSKYNKDFYKDRSELYGNPDIKLVYDPSKLKPWSVQQKIGSKWVLRSGWFIYEKNARKVLSQIKSSAPMKGKGKSISFFGKAFLVCLILVIISLFVSLAFQVGKPFVFALCILVFVTIAWIIKIFVEDLIIRFRK